MSVKWCIQLHKVQCTSVHACHLDAPAETALMYVDGKVISGVFVNFKNFKIVVKIEENRILLSFMRK